METIAATTSACSRSTSKWTRKKFASWVEKRTAASPRRRFKHKTGGFWHAQFTEVAHYKITRICPVPFVGRIEPAIDSPIFVIS
jgi:hypothetical protein